MEQVEGIHGMARLHLFKTIVENYNERREIAEFLGWEFDEDPTRTPN